MPTEPPARIILDLAIFAFILLGWWYIALPIALVCAWAMPAYVELPLFGLAYDSLYGLGRGLGAAGFLGIAVSSGCFLAVAALKLLAKR